MVCKSFGTLITGTIQSYERSKRAIDVTQEERYPHVDYSLGKCTKCRAIFIDTAQILSEMTTTGALGKLIHETIQELDVFSQI